jgi:hypothetical protein
LAVAWSAAFFSAVARSAARFLTIRLTGLDGTETAAVPASIESVDGELEIEPVRGPFTVTEPLEVSNLVVGLVTVSPPA